jgi:hypothetical protein
MQSWTDKDGKERKTAEIFVDEVKFLGGAMPSDLKAKEEEQVSSSLAH